VFIFFILLSATLAVMALLVKMGVIKESVQRKITVWIFNFINYLFRGAINLAVRLRIITLFQGEKFYVRTIGYFFDNLLTNLVILGIILVMAIILTVTYLLQGELSMITSYDVLAIGVKLPIEYELSRWSDLLFLLLWLFVFFLTYKLFYLFFPIEVEIFLEDYSGLLASNTNSSRICSRSGGGCYLWRRFLRISH